MTKERIRESAKKPEAAKENRTPQTHKSNYSQSVNSSIDRILFLQRTIGNQAVGRLIISGALQAKLEVNEPGDIYEQEADLIADQLMAMPMHQAISGAPPRIQRFSGQSNGQIDVAPTSVDYALASSGRPLELALRKDMEQRFGHDFSRVRVHTGTAAEQSAREVDAHAYTKGHDIVFGLDQFAPETHEGRRLIAHELMHVVQQSGLDSASPVTAPQTQLFRKPAVEAHYPTEDEQRKIEEILSRDFKNVGPTTAGGATTPEAGKPALTRGLSLNAGQKVALAKRLEEPFFDTVSSMDSDAAGKEAVLDQAQAFEVVQSARKAIFDRFGDYAIRTATLTLNTATTEESRKKADEILIEFHADLNDVLDFGRTISTTHCRVCARELVRLDEHSRTQVISMLVEAALQKRREQFQRAATKRIGGAYSSAKERIKLPLRARDAMFHSAVHELIHALAHPAFRAAFGDEDNVNEGFTDYFAHQIYGGNVDPGYAAVVGKIEAVREAMSGPFHFVGDKSAEESLRRAYFGGHLEYIGWVPSSPEEQKAVEKARGPAEEAREPAQWDADIARKREAAYRLQAQTQQGASRNVLYVGLFFSQKSSDTIAVRYARIIARTEPYAKEQLFLEGQLLGSPSLNPGVLGASLGIGAEYQEPYFYAGGGVRFIGTTLPGTGTNRLDVSPFVGFGVRPWQTIRVGAEGFVLVPLTGQNRELGVGFTLGVEFK